MKLKTILLISIAVWASSCSKEISLTLPQYNSKIVVNGEMDTENEISLQVSRSIPIMQSNDSSGYLIKDAVVQVIENGINIGTATYVAGRYELPVKPKAGANYQIKVSSGSYTPVQANLSIPKKLPVTLKYKDSIGLDAFGFKVGQITLNFTDDGSVSNYYKLLIRYYNAGTTVWFPLEITSNDILFINNTKLNDGGYIFSDRTFSGKTKTLVFDIPFGLATGTPKFEVSIKSFNLDYYDYLVAVENYRQNGNSTPQICKKDNIGKPIKMPMRK
jgi:hypothetical protein